VKEIGENRRTTEQWSNSKTSGDGKKKTFTFYNKSNRNNEQSIMNNTNEKQKEEKQIPKKIDNKLV